MKYLIPFLLIPVLAFGQTTIKPLTQDNIEAAITDDAGFRTEIGAPATGDVPSTPGDIGAEPALGNPDVSGKVLSSTDAGVRSWITPGGTVDNAAVNTAIEEDPALSLRSIQSDGSLPGLKNTLNNTPTAGQPINVSIIALGDSFNVGLAGGADSVANVAGAYRCGEATGGGSTGHTQYAIGYANSPDGVCWNIADGGNLTTGHLFTGVQGPANRIYYTLFPGTGTAQLQYSDNSGSWTNVGSAIDTTLISSVQIGALTIATPSQNIRARITATGGYVRGWIGQGMNDGGITYIGFATAGQDIGQTSSISETVWKAMIAGYVQSGGAQIVVNTWADYRFTTVAGTDPVGTEVWVVDGPMDRLLNWSREQNSAVDWLIIGPYQVDPGLLDAANATVDAAFTNIGIGSETNERILDSIVAQREWSVRNYEGFVDCTHLYPDYLEAYDRGIFGGSSKSVSSASQAANVVTLTFGAAHGWSTGARGAIRVSGITGSTGTDPNGRFYATATSTTQMTYTVTGAAGTYAGTITAILEDGVHVSDLGKQLRRAHIASQSNYRRVFSTGISSGGLLVGAARLAQQVTGYSGKGTTIAVTDQSGFAPTIGNIAANYHFFPNTSYPNYYQSVIYNSGVNTMRVGQMTGSTITATNEFRSASFSPVTNNQGRLGDIGQRWYALYSGGMTMGYAAVTTTYSVLKTDHLIHITNSAGADFNITIPLAYDTGSGNNDADTWAQKGRVLIFRNTSSTYTATLITRDGGGGLGNQKIDTATTLAVAPGETKRICAVGGAGITAADYGNWITF